MECIYNLPGLTSTHSGILLLAVSAKTGLDGWMLYTEIRSDAQPSVGDSGIKFEGMTVGPFCGL